MAATRFPTGIAVGGPAPAGGPSDRTIYIYDSFGNLLTQVTLPISAITDLTITSSIDGDDTVSKSTVLSAITSLQNKVNEILTALRNAGLLSS